MHAKAEIELAAGRVADAAETATEALARAEQYGRLKYVVASRRTLGSALLELGRGPEAAAAFRFALAEAERLRHPPAIWSSAASLARALAATGEDEAAESACPRALLLPRSEPSRRDPPVGRRAPRLRAPFEHR